jgi:hypothetical protein
MKIKKNSFRPILRTDFFKIDGKKNGEEKT